MSEQKQEVRTYRVTMSCEQCGTGEMEPTGVALMSFPAKYPHRCSNCDHAQSFNKMYPCIEHEATGPIRYGESMSRRVVCAANRSQVTGRIILGVRHWDSFMAQEIKRSDAGSDSYEQGFIDQQGEFMTREEAWEVATAAGQIVRRVGGDEGRLYSENLY